MTQRLDELTGPVEVGNLYMVPTVAGKWCGMKRHWPVIGPKHSDAHCLNFAWHHYHIDPRFLWAGARQEQDSQFWRVVASSPLMTSDRINTNGLPAPVWRPRKCLRLANRFLEHVQTLVSTNGNWRCHFDEWTGKQAKHDGRGWICPHRAVPLADHAQIDGIITCPLHMLRIDAATGVVLPPLERPVV
ncbi:Rieske 2Fe-2S domain-containing protein [Agrobacterium rhizogenes]|uniref:Rieske (2Fe-2S) protein n=1 Tax=Rhizobium rhizogenes TaxID=359 RepID=UPI0015721161|nr:Rieske 2Fe-2S domain-containing protein [Rhizobium rhizogenes]NTF87516.1 Rieske 2Fe-2S domain-containing protein [Rhizobium rhizogenes]